MPMAPCPLNNSTMTEIRFKHLRFLITESPADENLPAFIEVKTRTNITIDFSFFFSFLQTCLKYGVTTLVRVSEKTYDTKSIEAAGIKVYVCTSSICFSNQY